MNDKAFYRSKRFWGCLAAIVALAGDVVANGPSSENVVALAGAVFALYGGVVAQGPLVLRAPEPPLGMGEKW